MSADLLREAADVLEAEARARANVNRSWDDPEPEYSLALAAWLRQAAMDTWAHGIPECCADGCDECDDDKLAPHLRDALAVARAILRRPS